MEYLLKFGFSYASRTYYKMNITEFLNIMDLTPEEDRALLCSTSATLALCCLYRGFFLTKTICVCTYRRLIRGSTPPSVASTRSSKDEDTKEEPIYVGDLSEHVILRSIEPASFEKEKVLTQVNSIV